MATVTKAVGLRVNVKELQQIEEQIEAGKSNSVSDFLRQAMREKLSREMQA